MHQESEKFQKYLLKRLQTLSLSLSLGVYEESVIVSLSHGFVLFLQQIALSFKGNGTRGWIGWVMMDSLGDTIQ